jgi:GNAT superfamily N-acetyltransferase
MCETVAMFARGGLPPRIDSDGRLLVARRADALERALQGLHQRLLPQGNDLHIAILGVDPQRQGRGAGSVLLSLLCDIADADGVAAYLETSGERNEAFYSRKGSFSVAGRTVVDVGGSHVEELGMLRLPSGVENAKRTIFTQLN